LFRCLALLTLDPILYVRLAHFVSVRQVKNRLKVFEAHKLDKEYASDHNVLAKSSLVTVVREGHLRKVPPSVLVPGDVVHVHAGDRIWADMRVLSASVDARRDSSALTGESEWLPVSEASSARDLADTNNMLLDGCFLVRGECVAVVCSVRSATLLGRICSRSSPAISAEKPNKLQEVLQKAGLLCKTQDSATGIMETNSIVVELEALLGAERLVQMWAHGRFFHLGQHEHLAHKGADSLLVQSLVAASLLNQERGCRGNYHARAALVERELLNALPGSQSLSEQRKTLKQVVSKFRIKQQIEFDSEYRLLGFCGCVTPEFTVPDLRETALSGLSGEQQVTRVLANIVRGRGLPAMDSDGTSDPYVKYQLVDAHGNILAKHCTQTEDDTLDPVWMHQRQFAGPDLFGGGYTLELEVFDKDRFKDDYIGHASLKLSAGTHQIRLCAKDSLEVDPKLGTIEVRLLPIRADEEQPLPESAVLQCPPLPPLLENTGGSNSVLFPSSPSQRVAIVFGSVPEMLDSCQLLCAADGSKVNLTEDHREAILAANEIAIKHGQTTWACGFFEFDSKHLSSKKITAKYIREARHDVAFGSIFCFASTPLPGVRDSLRSLQCERFRVCCVSDRPKSVAGALLGSLLGESPSSFSFAEFSMPENDEHINNLLQGELPVLAAGFLLDHRVQLVRRMQELGAQVCAYGKTLQCSSMLRCADLAVAAPFSSDMVRDAADILVLDGFHFDSVVSALVHVRHREDLSRACCIQ